MSRKQRLQLGVSSFVLLAVAAVLWWLDAGGQQTVADAQARIRAAGLPTTIDEIRPPRVPDADNAALDLEKTQPLFAALPKIAGKDLWDWLTDFKKAHANAHRLRPAATQELAGVLESPPVREIMVLVRKAVAQKGYEAHLSYEKGVAGMIPNVAPGQDSARLLGWHARLAVSQDRPEQAYEDIWPMTVLAEFSANEPILLSQLSRHFKWLIALTELEQVAAQAPLPAAWNQKFSDRLAALDLPEGLARSLDGERFAISLATFEGMFRGQSLDGGLFGIQLDQWPDQIGDWPGWIGMQRYRFRSVIRQEYASYLDGVRALRLAVVAPVPRYAEMKQKMEEIERSVPAGRMLVKQIVPDLISLNKSLWKIPARVISASVGLALERYRTAKGGYPATLAELVPEFLPTVPVDIFSGQPLIYRTEPGGAVVYSVGPNLKDDGGVENRETDKDDQSWAAGAAAARKFAPPQKPAAEAEP